MEYELISHDPTTGNARIKFDYKGLVFEADYDLTKIIPGSQAILNEMGVAFEEAMQLKAIPRIIQTIKDHIDQGIITKDNIPRPAEPVIDQTLPPETKKK